MIRKFETILTFVNAIGTFSSDSDQIGVNIFIQNGTISQNATQRMNFFNGIFRSDLSNFLFVIAAAEI